MFFFEEFPVYIYDVKLPRVSEVQRAAEAAEKAAQMAKGAMKAWWVQDGFVGKMQWSGQIIATSRDLGPQKVAEEGKSPYFKQKSRLVKIL